MLNQPQMLASEALRITNKFANIRSWLFDKWGLKKYLIVNVIEWRNIFIKLSVMKNDGITLNGLRLIMDVFKVV